MLGGVARTRCVAPARREACKLEEVGEQGVALLRSDALGMELYAMHGMRLVLQPHDDAVRRFRRDLQAVGEEDRSTISEW